MVIVLQRDFKHLVHKVWIGVKFEQGLLEQLQLEGSRHTLGAIEADQAGMQIDTGILPFLAGARGCAPEIDGIAGHEGPIVLDDEG